MSRPKGSPKYGGRQAGSQNRISRELREVLKSIVENELEQLPERLNSLDTKDRVEAIIKLLPYTVPRLEATEITMTESFPPPRILTKEEAAIFLKELEASC